MIKKQEKKKIRTLRIRKKKKGGEEK